MVLHRLLPLVLVLLAMSCLDVTAADPRPPTPIAQISESASPNATLDLDRVDPAERDAVQRVVVLIDAQGPFPYRQDGSVFQNRERLLPAKPIGFWHEYTVPTPGSPDRGARRIVGGDDSSLHYTNDHYRSFVNIRGVR